MAASIDSVTLTHAHLDHSGYLPLLVRNGFAGPVVSTRATRDLCRLLLPDSGFLQEKDAEYANRHRFSKHDPAEPLYTEADAEAGHLRQTPPGLVSRLRAAELRWYRWRLCRPGEQGNARAEERCSLEHVASSP